MAKSKTYFEQVPVALAKQIIAQQVAAQEASAGAFLVTCGICGAPVGLELCKVDERGNAVHEKCYVAGLARKLSPRHQSRSRQQL